MIRNSLEFNSQIKNFCKSAADTEGDKIAAENAICSAFGSQIVDTTLILPAEAAFSVQTLALLF